LDFFRPRASSFFKTSTTPQAVALNAEAPAPIEPAIEVSSPARKVAIFVGEWELERREEFKSRKKRKEEKKRKKEEKERFSLSSFRPL